MEEAEDVPEVRSCLVPCRAAKHTEGAGHLPLGHSGPHECNAVGNDHRHERSGVVSCHRQAKILADEGFQSALSPSVIELAAYSLLFAISPLCYGMGCKEGASRERLWSRESL
jgi:hypothetical protein